MTGARPSSWDRGPEGPGEQDSCLPLLRPNDPRGTAPRPGGVTRPGPAQIVTSTHKSGQTENPRIINRVKQHNPDRKQCPDKEHISDRKYRPDS